MDYATLSLSDDQIINGITYARRKNKLEMMSINNFNQWCSAHKYDDNLLHSTYVPYYCISSIDGVFVLFATKQLMQQIQYTSLLPVDAAYKLICNDLPLLIFGLSDADRHFWSFGVALVSPKNTAKCFIKLFNQLQNISINQFNRQYTANCIMGDGAPGELICKFFSFNQSKDK